MSVSSPPRRAWLGLVALFALAFGLRLAVVLQYEARHPHADHPVIDEEAYEGWALEIAAGDWVGDEVFFQEPLYPYALALLFTACGHDRLALRVAQAALGGLCALFVARLARGLFGRGAGWIAGYGFALYRPALLLPCLLLKENLLLPIFALLALALTRAGPGRARRWLAIGLLAGFGALLRGNLLVLAPVLLVWPLGHAWLARARLRPAFVRSGAVLAGLALVLAPVALRNAAVGGVLALTTSGAGTNLYGGNNEHNSRGIATEFPWVRGVPEHEADDWRREAERRTGRALDPGEVSAYWTGALLESLRARPGMHVRILWNKLRLTLGTYEVPDNHDLEWDARFVPLLRAPFPGFAFAGTLGLAGLLAWLGTRAARRELRRELDDGARRALDLALLFALYLATIVLTVTSMRARLPLVVPLLPFAASFAISCFECLRHRRALASRVALPLALAALGVLPPVIAADERERERLGRDHNLCVQHLELGEVASAAPLARALLASDPANPRFHTLVADVEWREGRALRAQGEEERGRALVRAALARLEQVIAGGLANPRERARAYRLAGWIQLDLGAHAAAERHFRRARDFASDDPDFVFDHLQALVLVAESLPAGPERDARALEARALAELLRAGGGTGAALDDFEARLARLR